MADGYEDSNTYFFMQNCGKQSSTTVSLFSSSSSMSLASSPRAMPSLSLVPVFSLLSPVLPELLPLESFAFEAFRAASKSLNLSLLALNASSASTLSSYKNKSQVFYQFTNGCSYLSKSLVKAFLFNSFFTILFFSLSKQFHKNIFSNTFSSIKNPSNLRV